MFTATGCSTCRATRAASARTAAACPAIGVRRCHVQEPLGAQIVLVPAMADARQATAGRTFGPEHPIGPVVHAPDGGNGGDDLHPAGDDRPVQLAEGQDPTGERAHGRRRVEAMVARRAPTAPAARDRSRPPCRRPSAPPRPRLRLRRATGAAASPGTTPADRVVEGDTAHEDLPVGRRRDGRRPRCRPRRLPRAGTFVCLRHANPVLVSPGRPGRCARCPTPRAS